jgi:hypothetical protein
MNGRVYDPVIARFMSADPSIDGMTSMQGYNRYSYISNNPLTFMDPSGFWRIRIGPISAGGKSKDLAPIIAIAVAVVAPQFLAATFS